MDCPIEEVRVRIATVRLAQIGSRESVQSQSSEMRELATHSTEMVCVAE